jgi:hypothetical protein
VERIALELEAFLIEAQILDPADYFRRHNSRMIALQDDIGRAAADGDDDRVEELEDRLAEKLAQITPLLTRYQILQDSRDRATAGLADAESEYAVANASLEAAQEGTAVEASDAVALPRAARLLRQLLVVIVLATALAIGLIVLLELTTPTHGRGVASTSAVRSEPRGAADVAPVGAAPGERSPAAVRAAAQGRPSDRAARRRR